MFKLPIWTSKILLVLALIFETQGAVAQLSVERVELPAGEISITKSDENVFVFFGGGMEVDRVKNKEKGLEKKDTRSTDVILSELLKKQNPYKKVIIGISSFGGHLDVAYQIQKDLEGLQKAGIEVVTYVPDGAICVSSCLTIYLSAIKNKRFAGSGARFGIHACSSEVICDRKTTEQYRANLIAHGFSKQWMIKNADAFSSEKPTVLTKQQLLSSNTVKFFSQPSGWDQVSALEEFQSVPNQKMMKYFELFNNNGIR